MAASALGDVGRWWKIIAPIEDTPGHRAGLKSGDYITHIDGQLIGDVTPR